MEPIITTQKFSRRGLSYLWNNKQKIDPIQYDLITSIYNNRKKNMIDGEQSMTYKLSSTKQGKLGFGRLYGKKGSLEMIEKDCRGTLCNEFYYDIDIVNCHPVLLVQFAKSKYNKDLPQLEYYVDHRDEVLKAISDDRDEAKTEILRILYGGNNKLDITQALSKEMRTFAKFLCVQEEYVKLYEACVGSNNIYGTFMAYVAQTEERHCMLSMKKFFEKKKWSVDVLCYDGVMIRKREGVEADDDLLLEAQAYIKQNTTYEVSLTYKAFQGFDIPENTGELISGVNRSEYIEMKNDFEINHFYYVPTNQYAEVVDGIITLYELTHATEYFGIKYHFKLSDKHGDTIDFFGLWRSDKTRKMITHIDFKPFNDTTFVLPINFEYTKNEKADTNALKLFEELLLLNCGNNLVLRDYFRNYLAHLIQKPLELPGVSIILTGKKGTGKDTLINFMMKYVVGNRYSINYENNADFFEKHDMGCKDKFLVKIEEADRMLCLHNASALKSCITSETKTFNPKGQSKITTTNYCRFIFTTNKPNPVEMTEGERRFVIIPTSPERKGDTQYWNTIYKDLFTHQAGRAVADYLLSININDFNPRVLPVNEYQDNVVKNEEPSDETFFNSNTWDGEEITSSELFKLYKDFCINKDLEYVKTTNAFSRILTKYTKMGETVLLIKGHNENGNTYKKK